MAFEMLGNALWASLLKESEKLESAADANLQIQLVFIGNLFEEGEAKARIRRFLLRNNVHWLGPKPHGLLKG